MRKIFEFFKSLYTSQEAFVDYLLVDPESKEFTNLALLRHRIYFTPFATNIVLGMITFGHFAIAVHLKSKYYRFPCKDPEFSLDHYRISRKEYRALRDQQRTLYATHQAPGNLVLDVCAPHNVQYKEKQRKHIVAMILALVATVIPVLNLFFVIPAWWWYYLKYHDMKDATIKKKAYEHYLKHNPEIAANRGTKIVTVQEGTPLPRGKKGDTPPSTEEPQLLTKKVIQKHLHLQKNSFWKYFGQFMLLVLIVVIAAFNPLIWFAGIFWVLNVGSMMIDDVKRLRLKYVVLDRVLLNKSVLEYDDSPDDHLLWFASEDRSHPVSFKANPTFYREAIVNDEYYIVILKGDNGPSLCYPKSKWTI